MSQPAQGPRPAVRPKKLSMPSTPESGISFPTVMTSAMCGSPWRRPRVWNEVAALTTRQDWAGWRQKLIAGFSVRD